MWIGGRKGFGGGGNPSSVRRASGDLPAAIETGGGLGRNKNLTAVLMGTSGSSGGATALAAMPWQRGKLMAAKPTMPAAGSGGTAIPQDMVLPPWIKIDAHLSYWSQSAGRKTEVVVEMVNHKKCEVEISFVESGVWKVIPFSVIASVQNPLQGLWEAPKGDALLTATVEDKPKDEASASKEGERARSRSPKR
eukprot:TRINITY_DN30556_c0_g1_i1.p2 TRINITY_DN30556_c0_g1~~TRINITY_DN30556_c0_g1_i1.p2  ORF type:complete len:193 (+),score=43.62 TRINITY_DN30556_c0_g1_i1:75-653(+)